MTWEIYTRTIDNHCEFWSVELGSDKRSSHRVAYGRLGQSANSFSYPTAAEVDKKRREKLKKGYVYHGQGKTAEPKDAYKIKMECAC